MLTPASEAAGACRRAGAASMDSIQRKRSACGSTWPAASLMYAAHALAGYEPYAPVAEAVPP